MLHIYSFGKKDKNFLFMTPRQAQIMNDFTDAFFKSQANYLEETGNSWNPLVDPSITMIIPDSKPDLIKNYNKIVPGLNRQHTVRNKIYDIFKVKVKEEDIDDHLVKRI